MLRFDANISFLFTELPFLDRFAAAAAAGFSGVELLFPYEHEPHIVAQRLTQAALSLIMFNLPPGDWSAGEVGIAALPGREAEFEAGVERALPYVRALDCKLLHALAGIPPVGSSSAACETTYLRNLRFACDAVAPLGATIVIEPLNQRTRPGFFLRGTHHALAMIDKAGRGNIKLQHDFYNAQIIEGDLSATLRMAFPSIGHIQIANPPHRHEPGEGEIAFGSLFALLEELGYDGWIGCEYRPKTTTLDSLGWARQYGVVPKS